MFAFIEKMIKTVFSFMLSDFGPPNINKTPPRPNLHQSNVKQFGAGSGSGGESSVKADKQNIYP